MLNPDQTLRIGINNKNEMKEHKFFKEINWDKLVNKKYEPPHL